MQGARKITYEVSPGQPPRTSVVQTTPPEEQLESAAARVRPFILSEEPVYHASVLKAIKALVPQPVAADVAQYLQACKDDWKPYDSKSRDIRGYLMQIEDNDSGEVIELSDKVLGFAWIYGDTIHADEIRLKETDAFGLEHRFLAAVPIVTGVMATTILTLNLVRALIQAKMLSVPEELLELPVVEHRTEFTYEGAIYSAEVGTAIPESLTDEPGPEWKSTSPSGFLNRHLNEIAHNCVLAHRPSQRLAVSLIKEVLVELSCLAIHSGTLRGDAHHAIRSGERRSHPTGHRRFIPSSTEYRRIVRQERRLY